MTLQTFAKYYKNEIICHFRARLDFFPLASREKRQNSKTHIKTKNEKNNFFPRFRPFQEQQNDIIVRWFLHLAFDFAAF